MENKTRKLIVIDENMDKVIGAVCDAALKASGLQVISNVNDIIEGIVEEQFEGEDCSL